MKKYIRHYLLLIQIDFSAQTVSDNAKYSVLYQELAQASPLYQRKCTRPVVSFRILCIHIYPAFCYYLSSSILAWPRGTSS